MTFLQNLEPVVEKVLLEDGVLAVVGFDERGEEPGDFLGLGREINGFAIVLHLDVFREGFIGRREDDAVVFQGGPLFSPVALLALPPFILLVFLLALLLIFLFRAFPLLGLVAVRLLLDFGLFGLCGEGDVVVGIAFGFSAFDGYGFGAGEGDVVV
jgi:hypothetical protein